MESQQIAEPFCQSCGMPMKKTLNFIIFGFMFLIYLPVACNDISKIDPKKIEKTHRTLKFIEAKILTGVSYIDFKKSMQDFLTEILITKDLMRTNKEKEILQQYIDIYDIYNDSLKLWADKAEDNNLLSFVAFYKDIVKNTILRLSHSVNTKKEGVWLF
ncbi:MAG: hypothetical protein Q8N09_05865 [Thermodesulfovibrionia bacterium]|nr:hypothetical protein [Thermodesulfovibrionia bacterium]